MIWTVTYDDIATDELADLYNNAEDKRAVTSAADYIETLLRHDADQKGHVLNGTRLLVVLPLAVIFSVSPDDMLVKVLRVLRIP